MRCPMVLTACFILAYGSATHAADWYSKVDFGCFGDNNIASALSVWLPQQIDLRNAGGQQYYVALEKARIDSALATPKQVASLKLDAAQAKSLRAVLVRLADNYSVPVFAELGTSFLGGVTLNLAQGTVFSSVMSALSGLKNAQSANVRALSLLVAEGGEVLQILAAKQNEDRSTFAILTTEYRVQIGREVRRFPLRGCVYPVEVLVKEFETNEKFSNKIIKPREGGVWGVWDIEDSKWDSDELKYNYQDSEFYYFTRNGTEKQRISMWGGPWQFDAGGSTYKNFGLKMTSR